MMIIFDHCSNYDGAPSLFGEVYDMYTTGSFLQK